MCDDCNACVATKGMNGELEEVATIVVGQELGTSRHQEFHGIRVPSLGGDVQRSVLWSQTLRIDSVK